MAEFEELTLMRIFLGESDRWQRKPLYEVLMELLLEEGFAGATLVKGAMGFGSHHLTHTDKILRLSSDLPVIIEVVETQEKIDLLLPRIKEMSQGGMITLEKARVIRVYPKETE